MRANLSTHSSGRITVAVVGTRGLHSRLMAIGLFVLLVLSSAPSVWAQSGPAYVLHAARH